MWTVSSLWYIACQKGSGMYKVPLFWNSINESVVIWSLFLASKMYQLKWDFHGLYNIPNQSNLMTQYCTFESFRSTQLSKPQINVVPGYTLILLTKWVHPSNYSQSQKRDWRHIWEELIELQYPLPALWDMTMYKSDDILITSRGCRTGRQSSMKLIRWLNGSSVLEH